ncbi:POK7 protein, partial [Catharus fuscescens]|nr:POK7 protein [Catharus fuscescens]
MGALQPGLPSPVMLLEKWELLIIDLKDCFFTIPLHPDDSDSTPVQQQSNALQSASESHSFFHQSARALKRQFGITRADAGAIVAACPDCA